MSIPEHIIDSLELHGFTAQGQTAPLAALKESVRVSHPEYIRVWKSVQTTYGSVSVCSSWRGAKGLVQFIEDTSVLDNSPPVGISRIKITLKRIDTDGQFAPGNVYWRIPVYAVRTRKLAVLRREVPSSPKIPSALKETIITAASALTLEQQESRMNALFMRPFDSDGMGLTPEETMELDVLTELSLNLANREESENLP